MVRNNYDLIPEIRCRDCGWYKLDENWCVFWDQYHSPNGFCDEGVGKCCRNCDCSVFVHEYEVHRCMEKNETVDPLNVCDDWDRWMRDDA